MRIGLRRIILTCEDFVPLGWNLSQDPSDRTPEPHCCPGCHYEWGHRIIAPDRLLPKPGGQPGRWNRVEAHVCCSLAKWLDVSGYLGEEFLVPAGTVVFDDTYHIVPDVRVYLDTRTIDRGLLADLLQRARKRKAHGD